MGHKCFISFKTEDENYKTEIQKWSDNNKVDMIDKSLNEPIDSEDEDYIMRKIREDYLADSTVTIVLIGEHSAKIKERKSRNILSVSYRLHYTMARIILEMVFWA